MIVGEPTCIDLPTDCTDGDQDQVYSKQCVRSRHEIINGRFKDFECLKSRFHHDLKKHPTVFREVAVIVQLTLQERPLYEVDYKTKE